MNTINPRKKSVESRKLKVYPVCKSFIVKSIGVVILLALVFSLSTATAQESLNSTGGDASGSGGTFSFSFGQFACQSFFEGNSSVSQGVQHPFEFFEAEQTVPENYQLNNTTIAEDEILCYNALENVIVAGSEGPVAIQPNATAEFVAGQSIRFLTGFHAQAGSNVLGRITTTNDFCDGYRVPNILSAPPVVEKSIELNQPETQSDWLAPEMGVKVFPNPNNGRFTLSLTNIECNVLVNVYNMLGASIYQSGFLQEKDVQINLPFARKGIYFVRVTAGNEQFIKKIIVK